MGVGAAGAAGAAGLAAASPPFAGAFAASPPASFDGAGESPLPASPPLFEGFEEYRSAYQPPPFRMNVPPLISRLAVFAAHFGQASRAGSEIFWSSSHWLPQAVQAYSYVGIAAAGGMRGCPHCQPIRDQAREQAYAHKHFRPHRRSRAPAPAVTHERGRSHGGTTMEDTTMTRRAVAAIATSVVRFLFWVPRAVGAIAATP